MERAILLLCAGAVLLALGVGCSGGGGSPADPALEGIGGLELRVLGSVSIELTWTSVGAGATGIVVERSTDTPSAFATLVELAAEERSYTDTGLEPETTYHYRACCTTDTQRSANTTVVSAETPVLVPPVAPEQLEIHTFTPSIVVINWADASDNEDGFSVERSRDGGPFVARRVSPRNRRFHLEYGLDPDVEYKFRVRAYNRAGDSELGRSNTGEHELETRTPRGTTVSCEIEAPGTTNTGDYAVTITKAPGLGMEMLTLEEATDAAFTQNVETYILHSDSGTFTEIFSNKAVGTYYYKTKTLDSNIVAVTVTPRIPETVEVTLFAAADNSIAQMNWSESSNEDDWMQNKTYSSGELGVGNDYAVGWNDIDTYTMFGSLLWFDTSEIPEEATILSAELRLTVVEPIVVDGTEFSGQPTYPYGTYSCRAIKDDWDWQTVTWNTCPEWWIYPAPKPTSQTGAVWTWNTTEIVQDWVDGSRPDYGFILVDEFNVYPDYSQRQTAFFYSLDFTAPAGEPYEPQSVPQLVITYEH